MTIVRVTSEVQSGQGINVPEAHVSYWFDYAGESTTNWRSASIKLTFDNDNSKIGAAVLHSGDILDLNTPYGRITKIEAFYKVTFRVIS